MPDNQDLSKVLVDWSLAAGRYLQSKQTGYVHYCYGEPLKGAQTIPMMENVLFAFALLKSRLVEQIQEAKVLLKSLLAFQNLVEEEGYGLFPIYLHEYPLCKDPTTSLQLLAPFYWIISQFGHILGGDLKKKIEQAAQLVLEKSLLIHQIKPFPYSLAVRLAAAQLCYGSLWNEKEWQQNGKEELEKLAQQQLTGWYQARHLGDILVGLQMAYPSMKNTSWNELWQRMERTWHSQSGTYIGPCIKEWQEGEEPQVTLYDLFGGYFTGQFSRRATLVHPIHLQGSLIRPTPDRFQLHSPVPSIVQQPGWKTVCHQEWAYQFLEKKETLNPAINKTFTPYRLIWGDLHRTHSFVCQGGHYEKMNWNQEGNESFFVFDLKDSLPEEMPQQREIEFFMDVHPGISFHVNQVSTTTFEIGQPLAIETGKLRLSLKFDLIQGQGNFMGHIMKGNRPSQINQHGDNRFEAYDWTIFLRTIRRSGPCKVKVAFDVKFV